MMGFRCCFGRRLSFVASIVYEKAVILPLIFCTPDVVIQYISVVIRNSSSKISMPTAFMSSSDGVFDLRTGAELQPKKKILFT